FHVTGVQTCALPILLVVGTECAEAFDSVPVEDLRGSVLRLPEEGKQSSALTDYPSLAELARYAGSDDPPQCAQVRAGEKAFYIRSEERRVGKECRSE